MARKQDEHESMHKLVLEFQGRSEDNMSMGKLYHIVMLSRWQEAAVNKKYLVALEDVKAFRVDIMNLEKRLEDTHIEYQKTEQQLQEKNVEFEKIKQVMGSQNNFYLTLEKADELNTIIKNIAEDKDKLEEDYMKIRTVNIDSKLRIDELEARVTH